ncbi:lectin [Frateuria sp. Soil773]|uniref:hypothetical protein n=1 Tax=Frateuria sp. Soil773 TaxID=1736407 RepID=UPI0006F436FB|nr:hypothetical protein [Frateuria sp. Soil773]KRF01812.1 lectin [Frateuria sp. Soil773]
MMRRLPGLACALLLAACGNGAPSDGVPVAAAPPIKPAPAPADPAQPARYDGYGDLRLGMDEAAFAKAWGGELKGAPPSPGSSCKYKLPKWAKTPRDFAFMFEGGRFVRYDVGTAKEAAPGGGRVGMSLAQVHALYGAAVDEQPHKYVEGAKILRVAAPQGGGVLVFETGADGRVTRWRVGVPPQVDYVEGCG